MDRKLIVIFAISLAFPIASSLEAQAPADLTKIVINLFNDEFSEEPFILKHDLSNINDQFNAAKDTIVLIHGWNSDIEFARSFVPGKQYLSVYLK